MRVPGIVAAFLAAAVMLATGALAQAVNLSAPASAPLNSIVNVQWSGPNGDGDYVAIARADGTPIPYSSYFYTANSKDGSGQLRLPEEAGEYSVAYFSKADGATLAFITIAADPVSATIEGPSSVPAGSEFEVAWSGPNNDGDQLTIGNADGRAMPYQSRVYTNSAAATVTLEAPEEPGDYSVVYVTGRTVVAFMEFTAAALDATLEGPASVPANSPFTVAWTGPDNPDDRITIGDASGRPIPYSSYGYTAQQPGEVTLTAPEKPGEYTVAYVTGSTVVTFVPIAVTDLSATLDVPETVPAGSLFAVGWSGPDNDGDRIRVHTAEGTWIPYASYAYTALSPDGAELVAPEDLGPYTIAYVTGDTVVATAAFTVVEVTASLLAEDEVEGGLAFPVTWDGPGNPRDGIFMFGDDPNFTVARDYVANSDGNVVILVAPEQTGEFVLRYMTPGEKILAERPIRVVAPPEKPGMLEVAAVSGFTTLSALEIILDASGSMLQRQDGVRRIDIAKDTLTDLLNETVPPGTPFALRIFGHREADSCRTDLEVPLAPLDTGAVLGLVDQVEAVNLARTPIARSLELVAADLADADGERLVVLVTDGEETCEGDPPAAIARLRGQGADLRINIVGYAIDDAALAATFAEWASLGGGSYFPASGADELAAALAAATQPAFRVVNEDGAVLARGRAGDDPVSLPAGTYAVRVASAAGERTIEALVRPELLTSVSID